MIKRYLHISIPYKVNFIRLIYTILLALFFLPLAGKAQQVLKESFAYTASATNGLDEQSGNLWTALSGGGGNPDIVSANSLTHANIISSGNKILLNGASDGYYRSYPDPGEGTIYISFVFKLTALPVSTNGDYFMYISNGTGIIAPVYIRASTTSGKFNIGVAKRSGATINWLSNELAQNTTYHVVFSYTAVAGLNNDYVKLWLNPADMSVEPEADATATGNGDVGSLVNNNRLTLNHGGTDNAAMAMELDEIRVSTNWVQLAPLPNSSDDFVFVTDGNLSHPGLQASTGNKITFSTEEGAYYRSFAGQTSGTVYGSFILNVTSLSASTQSNYITCLGSQTQLSALVYLRASATSGKFNVGLAKNMDSPVTWLADDLDTNTPYYLVFSCTSLSGDANDKVKLWLNPTGFASEPTANAEISNGDDVADFSSMNRVLIYNGITARGGMGVEMDELRISTSWADLAILSVELVDFIVKPVNNATQISWVTLSENDNDYFEIEHSADGKNFQFLTKIKGKGTATGHTEYTVYDHQPVNGVNYYHLIQVDKDGTRTDLGIKAVSFRFDDAITASVYPNPTKAAINLLLQNYPPGNVQAVLSSLSGQVIHQENISVSTDIKNYPLHLLNTPAPGMYMLKIVGGNLNKSIKLVVQ